MITPLTGYKRFLSLLGLSLATFLIVLDYTIANVSIPYIAGDLSVSSNEGTYVITSFAVGNAIVLPISGWLTERIGSVRLLLISVLLFVFFSWVCGGAPNFHVLLIGRFLQGFVAGPLIPLSQSLIVSTNPPEKKNIVLAFWSVVVIAAPVIGPLLGGWISFDYHWSWIFYINIPFGLLSALLVFYTLKEFPSKTEKKPIDYRGFFLLAIGVTCLQIVLDRGEQYDWLRSHYIMTLSIICALAFCYLIVWEYLHPYPIIDLSLFKIHSYSVSVIFIGIMYAMYFGSVVLIPLWLQVYMGYNAIWAGIAVAPIGIAPFLFSAFSGKLVNRYGVLKPLVFCFVLFSISCFYTAYFTTAVDIWHLWISRFLVGTGLVFFITPLFSLSIQDIETKKLPQATGIFHFVRAMSGGIGTSIFNTLWIRRSAFHHERIGSNLTPSSELTDSFIQNLNSLGLKGEKALALTNNLVDEQASMLALNDCFYLMGWLFLLLILLLPLGRKGKSFSSP
ncbi:MAG: DHA2 family efflux MFS transporter permease subunit [Verrucomicrobia bacterium]|nr:DHA2 family efflux MFS transporter permease subunit [Verrucomicrobiota bacterium]